MDQSVTFARHFARLVWLLLHETGNIDEQKATLRALILLAKDGPVRLAVHERQLQANGAELPTALSGAADLAAQMAGHGVRELQVDAAASPADVLGVARILAADGFAGDGGRAAEAKLQALGARTVRLVLAAPASAPMRTASPVTDIDALFDEMAVDVLTPPEGFPMSARAPETAPAAPARPSGEPLAGEMMSDAGLWMQFSAASTPRGSSEELLAQLDATVSPMVATRLLDDLVTLADNAAREGRSLAVAETFHAIVKREATVDDNDMRRAYVMAIRRMSRPGLLRPVASLLPKKRERLAEYVAVLVRTGEDGADALIDQLTQAQGADDRRVLFDVLLQLQAGVPALIHMLGDARWFVVRNAADLLGEMVALEAEEPLRVLLRHEDDRVRRAASNSLVRLGTPTALSAIHEAIRDESPQVRKQAAAAIAGRRDEKSASTLVRALDEETDPEVQLALLAALGRVASEAAVQRLIRAAEPEGRFFRRKATEFRVAAVVALGEARTPTAMAAVGALQNDREREVREAVARVLAARAARPS